MSSPKSPKVSRKPCMCSNCEPADPAVGRPKARGICRTAGVGPRGEMSGAFALKSVPAGTPAREALLKSLMGNRMPRCPHATEGQAEACGCTWGKLMFTKQAHHTINKAHFTLGQLTHSDNANLGAASGVKLKEAAVADVPMSEVHAKVKQATQTAAAFSPVSPAHTTAGVSALLTPTAHRGGSASPRAGRSTRSSPRLEVPGGNPGKRRRVDADAEDAELIRERSVRRSLEGKMKALEVQLANERQAKQDAEAPLSVHALEHDPHLRSAVRQYTSFHSVRSFKACLDLMNANGRMETVNPSHCQHPTLGHDQHLYTVEDAEVRPGVWCETTWDLDPVAGDEPDMLKLGADEVVQVINPPTAEPGVGGDSDCVWVQTLDGKTKGKAPRGALTPLTDAEAGAARSYQHTNGRKRAMTWDNAVFFVL